MRRQGLIAALVSVLTASLIAAETEKAEKKAEETPLHEHETLVKMLEENNRLRSGVGLPPQELSPELTKAAQDHAWYMARTGHFSHHANGGPMARAARHGFERPVAENIAMGHHTIGDVFGGWRASGGHWANMTGREELAGFGYGISPNGERYWVAVYGH
ncbi:MAG: CAP domain-containing protein [Planctomycetota bacterium]